MVGGTPEFPDLGLHCQRSDCRQLDFLPFRCAGCHMVFCVEHRSYASHGCPEGDHDSRKMAVCEICSTAVEVTGLNDVEMKSLMQSHEKSKECDPTKKKKPRCPVRRCKETLTFSNTCLCKTCQVKFCLKHRLPIDHECKTGSLAVDSAYNPSNNRSFLDALTSMNVNDYAKTEQATKQSTSMSPRAPLVKVH